MGDFLHRTTKQYFKSISNVDLLEPLANYISQPDMSAVEGVPSQYWVITGDVVSEMSQAEKDVVDAATLTTRRDSTVNGEVDNVEGVMRQVIKLLIDELNILRAEHSLPDRTIAQLKTQIRNGLGS